MSKQQEAFKDYELVYNFMYDEPLKSWLTKENFSNKFLQWETLMEVVDKVENTKYNQEEVSLRITKYAVGFQLIDEDGVELTPNPFTEWGTYGGTEKLETVYKAVVSFIKNI